MRSMTGYGRFKGIAEGYDINFEVRSVNNRYFDCNIKLPRYYNFLEDKIREKLKTFIKRGKVEAYFYIKPIDKDEKLITLNEPLCENYVEVLTNLKDKFGFSEKIEMSTLTRFSDIFDSAYSELDEEEIAKIALGAVEQGINDFVKMRESEGERIKKDLEERLSIISKLTTEVEERAPMIVEAYRERLTKKMEEILNNIDEQRILQEAAIYADKITTSEETVRLQSHLKEFSKMLSSKNAIGKKLDFIVQEMNREANTIGSKCNDFDTSKIVVELKAQIENIREQIQNIE